MSRLHVSQSFINMSMSMTPSYDQFQCMVWWQLKDLKGVGTYFTMVSVCRFSRPWPLHIKSLITNFQGTLQNRKKRIPESSCLSVRPHETTGVPLDSLLWNLLFEFFFLRKSVEKIQVLLKPDKNNVNFTQRPSYIFDHILLISS